MNRFTRLGRNGMKRRSAGIPSYSDGKRMQQEEAETERIALEKAERERIKEADKGYSVLMKHLEADGGAQETKSGFAFPTRRKKKEPKELKLTKDVKKQVRTGTGKDITKAARNMTQVELNREMEADELAAVNEIDLAEAMRPVRSGEALYNKLVKQTKKRTVPKTVRKRIKRLREMEAAAPPDYDF